MKGSREVPGTAWTSFTDNFDELKSESGIRNFVEYSVQMLIIQEIARYSKVINLFSSRCSSSSYPVILCLHPHLPAFFDLSMLLKFCLSLNTFDKLCVSTRLSFSGNKWYGFFEILPDTRDFAIMKGNREGPGTAWMSLWCACLIQTDYELRNMDREKKQRQNPKWRSGSSRTGFDLAGLVETSV
ncbi:hypothetical protein HNY73_009626 [Argiope bruennichi]|uniref:Uncharacterized protein n=1 Tax=Argiope bruennichi TaxID=94029 RepID=A0A8T0FB29_ARGBR|nr:hypothetical protein HNY73_009626 [Argiope bruennichi]